MTTTNRFENWRIRLLGALALMLITLGLVQATSPTNGSGLPCSVCTTRCYAYLSGILKANGGCKLPNGMPDTQCLSEKCTTSGEYCSGCFANLPGTYIDCGHENCAAFGIIVGNGGNVCDNACYGLQCSASGWFTAAKTCGQVQIINCEVEANSSIGCSKCGCK